MDSTISLVPCSYSPRVENLADYIAGLKSIQRHGIAQTLFLHPEDIALIRLTSDL